MKSTLHRRETELVGSLDYDGEGRYEIADQTFWDVVPEAARSTDPMVYSGPRGRFRIVVEFIPEGNEPT